MAFRVVVELRETTIFFSTMKFITHKKNGFLQSTFHPIIGGITNENDCLAKRY
jgi:hypothetical protein